MTSQTRNGRERKKGEKQIIHSSTSRENKKREQIVREGRKERNSHFLHSFQKKGEEEGKGLRWKGQQLAMPAFSSPRIQLFFPSPFLELGDACMFPSPFSLP